MSEEHRYNMDEQDTKLLLQVLLAVRKGDFSARVPDNWTGVNGKIADTLNEIIDLMQRVNAETTKISKVVGKEGKISRRIPFEPGLGSWTDTVGAINAMIGDLTLPTNEMSRVIGAVAKGDLTQSVALEIEGRPLEGEFMRTARTVNTMVAQLNSFTSEVTRVAREVGTDGKLGGQAKVKGLSGSWKDLTDSVNSMASNLTAQVRNIAEVTVAVASGDLSRKITVDVRGEFLQLKDTINTMVDQLRSFASEVTRVAREVGTEGKLGGQAEVKGVAGTWKDLTDSVNFMAGNLTGQVRNIAEVTTAVANGDLTSKITVDAKGEFLELKNTINIMVDQLNAFASEVTRVAREVGAEGKLGGQADVKGVSGTWKDLTDSVNMLACNLTEQVRSIANVTTAVANGDLTSKITVDAHGELLELKNTINTMVDQLNGFASEVTRVAREVGVEGRLGGQANVPGAAGTWKDLTDNVNQLAANLTTQVRAITDVATSVTKGDLSRTIKVEARGEVEGLKNNINEMIRNLKETTQTNNEQDWLKTNLAKFTLMLQGQRDLSAVSRTLLSELAPLVKAHHGVFFIAETPEGGTGEPRFRLLSSYAYTERKNLSSVIRMGEGIVGQCAYEKQRILLTDVPHDYVQISSGLGEATPLNIIDLPILFEGEVKAVIELASFHRFSAINQTFLDQLMESIGPVLNTIEANTRTEALLKQYQSLAQELQNRQQELQQTNEQLQDKAHLLTEQKAQVEQKNLEVEQSRRALEEKAEQLSLTSKYKSEFLANMSHELRTPLNSLLILSQQLSENPDRHLTDKEVEFASTIHESGIDLLNLINDILDLSKIEAGKIVVQASDVPFSEICEHLDKNFRQMADAKGLDFVIELAPDLPRSVKTDVDRLQQILRNLLSNAFKFTPKGGVTLKMSVASGGWDPDQVSLASADRVIAFAVADTGIGIAADRHRVIFEAFQQADGSTSRTYGGTGLGLSISREIAKLLGGEITLQSEPGQGSTFTLFLPQSDASPVDNLVDKPVDKPVDMTAGSEEAAPLPQSSPERALQKTAIPSVPVKGRKTKGAVPKHREKDMTFPGKTILVVDDDVRNIFALSSLLERHKANMLHAENGRDAIETLKKNPGVDLVLMDIMLPGVDGYETTRAIRKMSRFSKLPIIALTAKAMVGDREKCIDAGASDYIAKPVDTEQLLALLRVWLNR